MLRFIGVNLRRRAHRAIGLLLGVAVATSSFVLLTSAARTSRAQTAGTVTANARSAYDILVRPKGSTTAFEAKQGLVQDNYLSGVFGGITLTAYEKIKQLPGVSVAAPVANLGYVQVVGSAHVDLKPYVSGSGADLFRVRPRYVGANGLARYPDAARYAYYSKNAFERSRLISAAATVERDGARKRWPCWYFNLDPDGTGGPPNPNLRQDVLAAPHSTSAFDPVIRSTLQCFSALTPARTNRLTGAPAGFVGVDIPVTYPMLVAAIDPDQEDALVGLGGALSQGRYLKAGDRPHLRTGQGQKLHPVPCSCPPMPSRTSI